MPLPEESQPITADNIDAILKFLPEFEQEDCDFGHMTPMEQTPDGSFVLPSFVLGETGGWFYHALYENGWIVDFGWPSWQDQAEQYCLHPEKLQSADINTIRRLLTTHVRKDRFCGGHLLSVFKSGHLTAVLRRLQAIRQSDSMVD